MTSPSPSSPGIRSVAVNTGSCLRISAELENLRVIRSFVGERGAALGADPDGLSDMILAVDEAATNVIVHGYRGQEGMLEVEVRPEADALVVCLHDQATPFDPDGIPAPALSAPLEKRPLGGMGVYIMRQLVDRVLHSVPPKGGNELTLIKNGILRHPTGGN